MIVGPRFGEWIAGGVHVSPLWVLLWPYIHWTIAVGLVVLATQALYFSVPTSSSISLPAYPEQLSLWPFGSAFLIFSALLSPSGEVQQNLWNPWSRDNFDDLVLLDRLCPAGGSETKCGTGEGK